jgi:hypothetical protein
MPDQEKISQREFVDTLRSNNPGLKTISDKDILNQVFQIHPELKDQLETPDEQAARAQKRAEYDSHAFGRMVTSSFPGIGGIAGSLLAPESAGMSVPLGVGAGRGLQDIANQMFGIEDTNVWQKAKNIGTDVGLAAAIPAGINFIKSPINSVRQVLSDTAGLAEKLPEYLPGSRFTKYLKPEKSLSELLKPKSSYSPNTGGGFLEKPPGYQEAPIEESFKTPSSTKTGSEVPGVPKSDRLMRYPKPTSTTMTIQPKPLFKIVVDENGHNILKRIEE